MIQLAAVSSASASHGSSRAAVTLGVSGAATQSRYGAGPAGLDGAVLVDVGVAEAARDGGSGRVGDLLDRRRRAGAARRPSARPARCPRSSVAAKRAIVSSVTASCSGWPGASSSARAAVSVEHVLDVERDALVAGGDRAARVLARSCAGTWVISKRPCSRLADLAAQPRERRAERALDVVRLQAAGPRLVHQRAQLRDVGLCERARSRARARRAAPRSRRRRCASMTCSIFARVSGSSP